MICAGLGEGGQVTDQGMYLISADEWANETVQEREGQTTGY